MKKLMMLASGSVAALALMAAAPAMAQSTSVDATWNGAGNFAFNANGQGSSTGVFNTFGASSAIGSINYTNQGNNPYGYGVSNTSMDVNASIDGGGWVQSSMTRDGSGAMYGTGGQSISGFAESSNGAAAMVQHTGVNYARLQDRGYGESRTAGGNTLEASGSVVAIGYSVNTGVAGNSGGINAIGSGSMSIRQNYSSVSSNGFSLANGGGIVTSAVFSANGAGQLNYGASGTGSVNVHGMGQSVVGTVDNPASFSATLTYGGAQTWSNWHLSGSSAGACVACVP